MECAFPHPYRFNHTTTPDPPPAPRTREEVEINIQLAFFGLNFNTMFLTLGIESKLVYGFLGLLGIYMVTSLSGEFQAPM